MAPTRPAPATGDRHRLPATTLRVDPTLKARAINVTAELGTDLTSHLVAFMRWLVGETDELPSRLDTPMADVADEARLIAVLRDHLPAFQAATRRHGQDGEDVLRRMLSAYETGGLQRQYRARSVDESHQVVADGLSGEYPQLRRMFSPKLWELDERDVFGYRPALPETQPPRG